MCIIYHHCQVVWDAIVQVILIISKQIYHAQERLNKYIYPTNNDFNKTREILIVIITITHKCIYKKNQNKMNGVKK